MTKYIDAEKLKAEIVKLRNPNAKILGETFVEGDVQRVMASGGVVMACEKILSYIASLQQEQPMEGLGEAANKWGLENQEGFCTQSMKVAAFKAGAEWMAGQGYTKEETVYFERLCDENRIMVDLGWGEPERGGFNPGDKVIVQIRKK